MLFSLNYKNSKPAYHQLADQVRQAVASGTLQPGDKLPSLRELAEQLGVNRNTVLRAFTELEAQGLLESRQGSGYFISSAPAMQPHTRRYREEVLAGLLDEAIVQAHQMRYADDDLRKLLAERLAYFASRRAAAGGGPAPPDE